MNIGESPLWQSNCLSVSRHNRREAREGCFSTMAVILVLLNALMMAFVSVPAVDSVPLMSPPLLPALLQSASRMPCLISSSHQLSSQSSGHKEGRASRARGQVPAHLTKNAVEYSHWSIAHRLTVRMTVPDTLGLSECLSLFCHASQLSQTLVGCILQGSTKCPLGKNVNRISQHLLLRFVPHRATTTAVRSELTSLRL